MTPPAGGWFTAAWLTVLLLFAPACGEEFSPEGVDGGPPLPPTEPFSLSVGAVGSQRARAVAVDGSGNIVVTGQFAEQIDFGGGPLISASAEQTDIFLVKLDPHGRHLWSKRFGGTYDDRGTAVAVDAAGNILLGASFYGLMDFAGQPVQASGNDVLIAKFTPDGDHVWHQVFGGIEGDTGTEEPLNLTLDSAGNIWVVGRFTYSLVLAQEHTATGDRADAFVAKLDPQGAPLWSMSFGGDHEDAAVDVAVGPADAVVVTGFFAGLATVAGNVWIAPEESYPYPNAFVLGLAADGAFVWGKNLGDEGHQQGIGVAVDDGGNVLTTGTFGGSIDFGGDVRSSHGNYDVYLARYASDGGLAWSWHAGDSQSEEGKHLAFTPDGTIVLGGEFEGALEFGTDVLHAEDGEDLFVAKFDGDAHPQWSRSYGGTADEAMTDMVVDAAGNVIAVGFFEGTIDFGQGVLSSQDGEDLFIAKLAP